MWTFISIFIYKNFFQWDDGTNTWSNDPPEEHGRWLHKSKVGFCFAKIGSGSESKLLVNSRNYSIFCSGHIHNLELYICSLCLLCINFRFFVCGEGEGVYNAIFCSLNLNPLASKENFSIHFFQFRFSSLQIFSFSQKIWSYL